MSSRKIIVNATAVNNMKSVVELVFCLIVLVSFCAGAVVELTDSTFEHQTQASTGQTTGKWFVKFYAPWCGHCKSLAPIWEELDQRLQDSNPQSGIILARVDATKQSELAERFKIKSYPVLKYFADRKMFHYKGARNIDALYDFVTEGYKSASSDVVPAAPSFYQAFMKEFRKKFQAMAEGHEQLKYLLQDFDHIIEYRKNAAAVLLIIGAFIGFVFGIIISLVVSLQKYQKRKKDKKE